MQSGITASQQLHTTFQTLVSSPDQRGLLCTIESESLKPLEVLSPATSSFDSDLSLLAPYLTPTTALYIILRRYPSTDPAPFIAVTYVPDAAPVRQKMLFASTRLTLVRELGIERFRETIFATMKEELTKEGFEKHDQHVGLKAPLTEEEESLGEVKRKEAEEGRGAGERRTMVSSGVSMPIEERALEALRNLKKGDSLNLVQLKINIAIETMELATTSTTPVSELTTAISSTEPRYTFYRYKYTFNDAVVDAILFIYTCPSGSKIKERMLYAASSRSAIELAQTEAGLTIDKKLEASSPEEITEESIEADLHPKVEAKRGFDRPKRPGRK